MVPSQDSALAATVGGGPMLVYPDPTIQQDSGPEQAASRGERNFSVS